VSQHPKVYAVVMPRVLLNLMGRTLRIVTDNPGGLNGSVQHHLI
jgi:hypothetical protein